MDDARATPIDRLASALRRLVTAVLLTAALGLPASAATVGDARSYDQKLLRLTEILGSVHYLRAVCGADDGQRWREIASELVRTEGSSALRQATIAQRFNAGYRSYWRTYRRCTPSARNSIARFVKEMREIANDLIKLSE